MKNVTLAIDEEELAAARRYAAERNTTLNRLIRDYVHQIAVNGDRLRQARQKIRQLSRESTGKVGPITWTRDDLHAR
jgi:hypothetical protein